MSHHASQVGPKPVCALWGAVLIVLLAAAWLLLLVSGGQPILRFRSDGQPAATGLVRRGPRANRHRAAGAPPATPLPTCELQLDQGPLATNCTVLRDVCVDQVGCCWPDVGQSKAVCLPLRHRCRLQGACAAHTPSGAPPLAAPLLNQAPCCQPPHCTSRAASSCTIPSIGRGGPTGRPSACPGCRAPGEARHITLPIGARPACTT